jgi:hypothetical protein
MSEFNLRPVCKIPGLFTGEPLWLNNGDMVHGIDQNMGSEVTLKTTVDMVKRQR